MSGRTGRAEGCGYVVDASAIVPLVASLGEALLDAAARCRLHALDLTLYEACNAFWKEAALLHRLAPEASEALCAALSGLARLGRITLHSLQELGPARVIHTAFETGLTFYDASYLVLSEALGLALATDDRRLRDAARERGVATVAAEELASILQD